MAWGSIFSTAPSNGRFGIGCDAHLGGRPGLHLADVDFVHQHAHAYTREIRHLQQQRAAADVAHGRRDHLTLLDQPLDDGTRDGGDDVRVAERDGGVLHLDFAPHHFGLGVGMFE